MDDDGSGRELRAPSIHVPPTLPTAALVLDKGNVAPGPDDCAEMTEDQTRDVPALNQESTILENGKFL
jgi:hypothetical protein